MADTIVIGARRPELIDHLLGPNDARVARQTNRSLCFAR